MLTSLHDIVYYRISGLPLLLYLGILALLSMLTAAAIALGKVTRTSMKWHHRLAFLSIGLAIVHGAFGIFGGLGGGNRGLAGYPGTPSGYSGPQIGKQIFERSCGGCHPGGRNLIYPDLPIRGSKILSDFQTFHRFIRDPRMPDGTKGPMPSFSEEQLSVEQAKELYRFIISEGG